MIDTHSTSPNPSWAPRSLLQHIEMGVRDGLVGADLKQVEELALDLRGEAAVNVKRTVHSRSTPPRREIAGQA
jgi:hypothetical protein